MGKISGKGMLMSLMVMASLQGAVVDYSKSSEFPPPKKKGKIKAKRRKK